MPYKFCSHEFSSFSAQSIEVLSRVEASTDLDGPERLIVEAVELNFGRTCSRQLNCSFQISDRSSYTGC